MTDTEKAPERLLTVQEVATRMHVNVRYVRRLLEERRLSFRKYGPHRTSPIRIAEADVEKFMAATLVEAEGTG